MTQYITKLPAVFQTVTEKKFFDATFDQVFSKKDSDTLAGYLGQRIPGKYNPVTDFYIPEPTKDRTWWQLEATAFARNADTTKTNVFFYDDLLNRINYYGGNTLNQDRLFESNYYSWAPPIDFDMFNNYQNYYWVEQGLITINISGVSDADIANNIIGKASYTTPLTATPANLTLTTGMTVLFTDSLLYTEPVTIENVGCREYSAITTTTQTGGIRLVKPSADYTAGTILEFLPWDGLVELANGRVIRNTNWDTLTWDTQSQPGNGDYITIERGSADNNAWSRTNKWYHIDTINTTAVATGTAFPANAARALRPIIQFIADLILWNSGTQFNTELNYGFRDNELGFPLLLIDYQGAQLSTINSLFNISLSDGNLVCFFNDHTPVIADYFPWDTSAWDSSEWDAGDDTTLNHFIFRANIQPDGSVNFAPHTSWATPVVEGDIVLIAEDGPWNAAQRGQTWYYSNGSWVIAANDKIATNQPPLFQLYDHNAIPLNDATAYPLSTFAGSKIFSYKVNTAPGATVDPVLQFPIVYTSLGQASDIIFQNNLITDRYTYNSISIRTPIDGYYYYACTDNPVHYNNWNLYNPCECVVPAPVDCINTSKQRVIDKFVVGYGTKYQFKLSVVPYSYSVSDFVVSVNGIEVKSIIDQANGYIISTINNSQYVDLELYLSNLLLVTQSRPPVVEILSYTHGLLANDANGYFEIPQQLNANPSQLEVDEISASNLIAQFTSIIENQIGFAGVAFGGDNNYRDSLKNRSVGSFILQNTAPLLKTMLVSSSNDLDVIAGIRFSQDEYTKFKNKYLRSALQLINQEFNPVQYHNNTIVVSAWVEAILKTINISKEFSNAFAYSYMVANGNPVYTETQTVPLSGLVTLTNYVDLNDVRNALYIYDTTGQEKLLVIGADYEIVSTNTPIEIQFNILSIPAGNDVYFALYRNPVPAYIPSTPTKVGAYGVYIPRMELDTSYVVPTYVIIGHDGSKTIAYGDYRDDLLLELERRIYNLLQFKLRNQYYVPLRIEDVKSGYFRLTRYSRNEYLNITESYINKWSAKNKANYRANDWATVSIDPLVTTSNLWKLYNYSDAVTPLGAKLGLPGNWKGIFQYYYDTIFPDIRPWEMLGFTAIPPWWVAQYGTDWSSLNTALWADLEDGMIRQGPSAIFNPVTLQPQPQEMWARPGLSAIIPVDAAGTIRPVLDITNPANSLFDIAYSNNPYEPFDGFDNTWVYGDGAPVEQAWMSTSGYAFSIQEFLYLMRPAPFGELLFDTIGTELSPGVLTIPGVDGPVMSNVNWQYVQNDTYVSADTFFSWMRPKNKDQLVHGEIVDNEVQIRFGYQRWISDRILFLNKDVGTTFGQKVRTLDVNLANKLAGFTNKDTASTYIESVTPGVSNTSLAIPSNNFSVLLHKGQPIKTYSYSGVIIRALENGLFVVYGYDLLNSEFIVLNRSDAQAIDITIGGTPSEFKLYTIGETYQPGDIVRYNGVYYLSKSVQLVGKFNIDGWEKLRALPTVGGISVTYRPISETSSVTVPYGSVFSSVQEVFDLLIGWGAYLETQGWKFDEVSQDTNQLSDWLYSAKQFLFWLNTNWAPDASIQLSPVANVATLIVETGYPDDVESISNGIYSVLDKFGVAIPPTGTSTDRDGRQISVSPIDLSVGGIYFLQINASETEHVLIFDNSTSFSDVIYDPLLRERQARLRFNGSRSNGWYGKMEAPGYLIIDNQLVPNYDTIVNDMRYYYDANVTIDNPSLEDLGRHLIGYESKSYLDNLQVSNDVQYLFYQGAIRQKGTIQAFDKLFRSTKVQSNEIIEVYEEWALKLGDFGNTIEQVSTEFILKPEQNTGEVIVARLNYKPSTVGFIKQINIMNAENVYINVPKIIIPLPEDAPAGWVVFSSADSYTDSSIVRYDNIQGNPEYYQSNIVQGPSLFVSANWTLILQTRRARAYAVLDNSGRISRIDMTDVGSGYLEAPSIYIDAGAEESNLDKLYGVWQGNIVKDVSLENIVEIDIDDVNVWIVRPPEPEYSLEFPVTDNIEYSLPNAGYVNLNDTTWTLFDAEQTVTKWGTDFLNPSALDTVWVAKTFTEDWNVYKMVNISPIMWSVIESPTGDLLLLTQLGTELVPQLSTTAGAQTDFGSMICLQIAINGVADKNNNFALQFQSAGLYTDPLTLIEYNSYTLLDIEGNPVPLTTIPRYSELTDLLLFKSMRFINTPVEPLLPIYVGLGDLIWVDDIAGKWAVIKISADPGVWDITYWDIEIPEFWKVPAILSPANPYYAYGWDVSGPLYFTLYRVQGQLINTKLFESAEVFQTRTENELVLLPVYDPFKGILPAPAKQNISYMLLQDPAKYNVTDNLRLFSENITFGEPQVGKLWWDLSQVRYVYYEQPMALDGNETPTDNIEYRRDHWGQIFPGSEIRIYEWVKSQVPPALYTGTGVPRSTTSYVELITSNRFTNLTEINYYFWVLNTTDKPNIENRTLAAVDVARFLASPKSQGFAFFSPIQQTENNNSYMFYNVQEILSYQGNNVQIRYRLAERNDQEHTQWKFFREGDPASHVTDQYWNKMVDSLCAYTKVLPVSNEWSNSILVAEDLPWDIYGWDIALWDGATDTNSAIYGEILPVPDPSLSEAEKYGITYRPRQGMFVKLYSARKVFVESGNNLLQHIPIRDNNPSWDIGVSSDVYWSYTNWYELGFEDAIPTVVFETLTEAHSALVAGQLINGAIVEISNGTPDGRFVLYNVIQINPNVSAQSFQKIGIELSAIKLDTTIYTSRNAYSLSVELRELLTALRTTVFINAFIVDQNELYFSMLNYVVSEQKNPDWVFKTSYIYIKENNIPLTQDALYIPDQINNIISYIIDAKPYHTQIRDYTSTYLASDIAVGNATDTFLSNTILQFGPDYGAAGSAGAWDANCEDPTQLDRWDNIAWDICPGNYSYMLNAQTNTIDDNIFGINPLLTIPVDQLVSMENVYTIPLVFYDVSKVGYSTLYPYTFDFNSLNLNSPQSFITPYNIVGVRIGTTTLFYGQDYYVEYNNDATYTVYFFSDPGVSPVPEALVLWDAGGFLSFKYSTYRTEIAYGFPEQDFVVNVDTKLPVNNVSGTLHPFAPWGTTLSDVDPLVAAQIVAAGGSPIYNPLDPVTLELLPVTVSYKQNLSKNINTLHRNAERMSGVLVHDLLAPTALTENLDVITVFVDPLTHPITTDILVEPGPGSTPGVIWISGERIEYRSKTATVANTWELSLVRRGTKGTAPTLHTALIPQLDNPLISVPNPVWVENQNSMPLGSDAVVWNATDTLPDLSSLVNGYDMLPWDSIAWDSDAMYSNVTSVSPGGIWYASTTQAEFLKTEIGTAIP